MPLAVAAGNTPEVRVVDHSWPQAFSRTSDTMVIVGAVIEAADVWRGNVADPNCKIAVYAPDVDIRVPAAQNQLPTDVAARSGTSHATAVVVCTPLISIALTNNVTVRSHRILLWPTRLERRSTGPRHQGPSPAVCVGTKRRSCTSEPQKTRGCSQLSPRTSFTDKLLLSTSRTVWNA